MYRLGLRLTLRSGREPFVRLLVTAAAVAVGVAIMLAVLADFHAFEVTNNRPSWETTQGQPAAADHAPAARSELWNYSNDIYAGQTIERLDVAPLGPGAPVPPGISALPASGQYYASPALAALIRTVPRDELGDRFGGRLAGTIGRRALTGPDELVIYVGYAPAKLAGLPATMVVDRINAAPGRQVWSSYFRDAFIGGALAFLFPILILVGTATRLAAARREERYAALRLVGATSGQIGVIASVDALASALLGAVAGIGIFTLLQPALAGTAITSARYFAAEVTPTAAGYLIVLLGVPAAAVISALLSLERVRISPLGVSRRVTPPEPSAWRIAPLLAGLALLILGLALTSRQAIGGPCRPRTAHHPDRPRRRRPVADGAGGAALRPDHDWRVGAAGGEAPGRQPGGCLPVRPGDRAGRLPRHCPGRPAAGRRLHCRHPERDSAAQRAAGRVHVRSGLRQRCQLQRSRRARWHPGGSDRPPAAHRGGRAAPADRRDTASRPARVPGRRRDSRLLAAAEPESGEPRGLAVPVPGPAVLPAMRS